MSNPKPKNCGKDCLNCSKHTDCVLDCFPDDDYACWQPKAAEPQGINIKRCWFMPSSNTLSIPCFAEAWTRNSRGITVDPFARDSELCIHTNDLNPNTKAKYHMLALDFLKMLRFSDVKPDAIIFDPPYTLRQVKECYEGVGKDFGGYDSRNAVRWTDERDIISEIQPVGGVVLSFGYTTTCMGKKRGYEIKEIIICSHGPAHNDTLCTIEIKGGLL